MLSQTLKTVKKAEKEAADMVVEAKEKAASIIEEAKASAEKIDRDAKAAASRDAAEKIASAEEKSKAARDSFAEELTGVLGEQKAAAEGRSSEAVDRVIAMLTA